jgi:hypothetical protein
MIVGWSTANRPLMLAVRDTAEFCAKSSLVREVLTQSGGLEE